MSEDTEWSQRHAAELRDHWWWRPGWHVGTRFYAWHITFDDAPELHRFTAFWQDRLRAFDYLDLIPHRWLHLTMQGVGMVQDTPDETRGGIVAAVRKRLFELAPVRVTFHRPVVRAEAIAMPPNPSSAVDVIRRAIRTGIADVIGTTAVLERPDGFQPHVSLAYVNQDHPAADVIDTIERTAGPDAMPVDVTKAWLIEMHRDNRMYEWRTIADAPVGPSRRIDVAVRYRGGPATR
jgi:2'-5' RNA ligase